MTNNDISSPKNGMEATLTATEKQLFDEFVAEAKGLEKYGYTSSYGAIAETAEAVAQLKASRETAIPLLARGIDKLKKKKKQLKEKKQTKRWKRWGWPLKIFLVGVYAFIAISLAVISEHLTQNNNAFYGQISEGAAYVMLYLGMAIAFIYPITMD